MIFKYIRSGYKMFEEYSQLVQDAKEIEQSINSKYDKRREELASNFKKETDSEVIEIEKTLLKDYSPVKFYNSLTVIVNEYKKLDDKREEELKKNKQELDMKLSKITETKSDVCEMYKIISMSSQNKDHFCRVWFTLVPIEKWNCVPGDPVRVEWLHIPHNSQRMDDRTNNVTHTTHREGPGLDGLKIPNFDADGRVTNAGQTFPVKNWGVNSNQKTWWENWVKQNRPC